MIIFSLFLDYPNEIKPSGPGCAINFIPKKDFLLKNNLVLERIRCSKPAPGSKKCLSKESYVKYKCINGYRFKNNDGKFIMKFFR